MTNTLLRLRFSVVASLGLIPGAEKIEEKNNALQQELNRLGEIASSEKLNRYLELEKFITSPEFKRRKKDINAQRFKGTPQYEKYKRYQELKRSSDVKTYYRVKDSKELKQFEETSNSKELKRFEELELFFNSDKFTEFLNKLKEDKKQRKEEIKKTEKRYKSLKKELKPYFKIEGSEALKRFNEVAGSDKLKRYEELKDFVDQTDFEKFKKDLATKQKELKDTYKKNHKRLQTLEKLKRKLEMKKPEPKLDEQELEELRQKVNKADFQKQMDELQPAKQDAFKKLEEFNQLKKYPDIKEYHKVKDKDKVSSEHKSHERIDRFVELKEFVDKTDFNRLKDELKAKRKKLEKAYRENEKRLKELEKIKRKLEKKKPDPIVDEEELKDLRKKVDKMQLDEQLKALKPENQEAFQKREEFRKLKKDSDIRHYFKFKERKDYRQYLDLKDSDKLKEYRELDERIKAGELQKMKDSLKNYEFKNTDEHKQYQEHKQLKKSKKLRDYFRFKQSKKYKTYTELHNSQKIEELEELQEYVNSQEFIDFKKYMETRNKFKLSEEYKQLQEFNKLKKDRDIKWYYQNKDSRKYDEIRNWELTFEDNFEQPVLDSEKWITSYYTAQKFLKGNYVTGHAHHFFNPNENLQIKEGCLQLITRKQQMQGLAWNPDFGFLPKDFEYTSAIISSGDHFSQKYGRFSVKVRMDYVWPLMHACWLSTGTQLPEVDIFSLDRKSKKKLSMALHHNGNQPQSLKSKVSGYNFARDFVIFSLDWQPGEMIWKINDKKVKVEKQHVPDQPLFINLSSGIYSNHRPATLPASMEIDWVRVYKNKE